MLGDQYLDPLQPGMNPAYCMIYFVNATQTVNGTTLCFVLMGNAVVLPLLNQNGYDKDEPSYCACSSSVGEEQREQCSVFDLLPSLLFYNIPQTVRNSDDTLQKSVLSLMELRFQYEQYDLSERAYNASFAAAASTNPDADPIMRTPSWRDEAYEFCLSSNFGPCSLLTWHLYDELDQSVSPFMYQLQNSSCTDSITMPYEVWNRLYSQEPPANLETGYFKCTMTDSAAMLNSVGIASGNVGLMVPLLMILLLPLIYTWLKFIGFTPPKEEYTDADKENTTAILVTQVLRMRDGKTRGMGRMHTLRKLTDELLQAATLDPGYPDSDDSDEDGDELEMEKASAGAGGSPQRSRGMLRRGSSRRGSTFLREDEESRGRPGMGMMRQASRRGSAFGAAEEGTQGDVEAPSSRMGTVNRRGSRFIGEGEQSGGTMNRRGSRFIGEGEQARAMRRGSSSDGSSSDDSPGQTRRKSGFPVRSAGAVSPVQEEQPSGDSSAQLPAPAPVPDQSVMR